MSLPKPQTGANPNLGLTLSQWATQLSPLMDSPLAQPVILKKVALSAGTNTIPHKLGRPLQGWLIVRQRGATSPTKALSDWTACTSTTALTGGTTTAPGFCRRIGDSLQVHLDMTFTSVFTGGTATFTVPTFNGVSLTIDSAKVTASPVAQVNPVFGTAHYHDVSVPDTFLGNVVWNNTTTVFLKRAAPASPSISEVNNISTTSPMTWANGDRIMVDFLVPIVGWAVTDSSFVQAYDVQDSNPYPDKTLLLVSSGTATVDILVF